MTLPRRTLLTGGAALALPWALPTGVRAQAALPPATPSSHPYHALRGGTPHHLSAEQEAQRFTESTGRPAGAAAGRCGPRCRSRAARWRGRPRSTAACTSSAATAKAP